MKTLVGGLLAALTLAATSVLADTPPAAPPAAPPAPTFVRGVVTKVTADSVTVRPKSGKPVLIGLAQGWTVAVMKPITADAIQTGSFIGTAEMPQANGTGRSLEVHVFPPGVKMGEGHYGWDLRKGSMMTNGTVGTVVAGHHGREMDVSYPGGTRKIVVPKNAPIVQITGGTQALIKRGVGVFIVARPGPSGGLMSNSVSTGENGVAPPM
ncbi:MAG: hypothetical protein ACHP84_13120 [Caulobacterales bacterium]